MTISVKNEDCFSFLPQIKSNSIDLVLTDPPYIISKQTGFSAVKNGVDRFAISMDFGNWDKEFQGLDVVVQNFYRTLKKGGTCIIFYDLWKITDLKGIMENAGFKQIRLIEWIKTNPVPLNSKVNYLTNAREIALLGVKGSNPTFNSTYDNGIYEYPIYHSKDRFHPTQKPLELFQDLITKHSNKDDIVLDCFLGSGTTAIACQNTERNFIGCELDSDYYGKLENRLNVNKKKVLLSINEKAKI